MAEPSDSAADAAVRAAAEFNASMARIQAQARESAAALRHLRDIGHRGATAMKALAREADRDE